MHSPEKSRAVKQLLSVHFPGVDDVLGLFWTALAVQHIVDDVSGFRLSYLVLFKACFSQEFSLKFVTTDEVTLNFLIMTFLQRLQ